MNWVPDNTGTFGIRPYYPLSELNSRFDELWVSYCKSKGKATHYPIPTDDITNIIEQHTSDLDIYADLSQYGAAAEGVTFFPEGTRPIVKISESLASNSQNEHRFRMTLCHELGHVLLHSRSAAKPMWDQARLTGPASSHDIGWMEYHARYAAAAMLMPARELRRVFLSFWQDLGVSIGPSSLDARSVHGWVGNVSKRFSVSHEAARFRLRELNMLEARENVARDRRNPSGGLVHCSEVLVLLQEEYLPRFAKSA